MKNTVLISGINTRRVNPRWVLVIFIAFLVNNFAFCFDFDLLPLKTNFNGAIAGKRNIIVYGDYGLYFLSTDGGKSWSQKDIGIFKHIYNMSAYNDTLWGITEGNYLIYSPDEGLSWHTSPIDVDTDEIIINFLIIDDFFYFRGNRTIYKFDRNLKLISQITSDTLFLNLKHPLSYYFDPDIPFLKLDSYKYNVEGRFFHWYDKIIFNTNTLYKPPKLWFTDKNLTKIESINVKDRFPFNVDSLSFIINEIYNFKGQDVMKIFDHLFFVDSALSKFTYFFENPDYLNYLDSTGEMNYRKRRDIYGIAPHTVLLYKNNLYGEFALDSNLDENVNPRSYGIFGVKKYQKLNGKDTFLLVGDYYRHIYRTSNYSFDHPLEPGINYADLRFLPLHPLNIFLDSVFVKFYNYKTLVVSTNYGKEWKLVSYLKGKPKYIYNDSLFYFVNDFPNASDINHSRDGIFWKPLIAYDTATKVREIGQRYFRDLQVFYLDSTGYGFTTGRMDYGPAMFHITYNFWETFKGRNSNFYLTAAPNDIPRYASNVCRFDSLLLIVINDTNRIIPSDKDRPKWNYFVHWIYLGDTSLRKFRTVLRDTTSFSAVIYIMPRTVGDFDAICIVSDTTDTTRTTFEIRRTQDTGRTWTVLHKIDNWGQISQIYELNKDSIFITLKFPDRVYLYDRIQDKLQLLWKSDSGDYRPLLMILSGKFYLVGRGLYLENSDRNDLTRWWKGHWDYGKPNFESVIFRGNVAIAGLSDSLRPFNYYKITLKKQEPSIVKETTVEKRYYTTHFWASEPYPQPAKVRVKARVAWDGSFDLREAIDGVYDTMGRKVEGKERIRVDARSTTSGELEWECSGVPAGIYFILIRWSGGSETVPVVVE